MWLSMIFIIVQIFTATLSAWLTLDQMRPRLPTSYENVGYQDGSFLKEFIQQKYNCSGSTPLKGVEEYKTALSSGRVNAIFDELPYIELFLAKYGSSYMKFGPINQESGIAFVIRSHKVLLRALCTCVVPSHTVALWGVMPLETVVIKPLRYHYSIN
ncbi:hypothetical protein HanIR_Chr09g0400891 [Helianthus annuus]|nr:hypothetical protein HanIR_Chr09g0400891 [Helianthus annuus]